MIVAGFDLGSATSKIVIVKDDHLVSYSIFSSSARPETTANMVLNDALKKAGLKSIDNIDYIMGTGYGRLKIPFLNANMSEIACHARGAVSLRSTVRTIIDIGGQDCKAISVNDKGKVIEFAMNDRCAAGTGRFFESMSRAMECTLEDISSSANQGPNPVNISSQCSVFAESEVVSLIYDGIAFENIIAGINNSVACRLISMINKVGLTEELVLTGGCAKNSGLAMAIERLLGIKPKLLPIDPQLIGAIGAALFAIEKLSSGKTINLLIPEDFIISHEMYIR